MAAVVAPLQYLAPHAGLLHTYAYDPPDGAPRFNGRLVEQAMAVEDARALAGGATLAVQGFQLVPQRAPGADPAEDAAFVRAAYPEAEALVRDLTGAPCARAFDHTLRQRAPHKPPLDGSGGSFAALREPVGRVHADYTPLSAPVRVRQVLGEEGAARAARGRYLVVGLWRPLLEVPLEDAPLALADARSVVQEDLVPNDLVYRERRGQTYAVLHRAAHRWNWFPRQTRDEVTAFIHYDSATALAPVTGAVPHTAFENPLAPADAPPRRSVEMRVLAWFAD